MKAIITRGFPASGKSTYAQKLVDENGNGFREVNSDEIRMLMGFPAVGTESQEVAVNSIKETLIAAHAAEGNNVVVSDTNLVARHLKKLIAFCEGNDYEIELVDFQPELHTLIKRDRRREKSVGEDVIRMLWGKYPYKEWKPLPVLQEENKRSTDSTTFTPVKQDPSLPPAVVVDVDSTLARPAHRDPLDDTRLETDEPNRNIIDLVKALSTNHTIIVLTGRRERHYDITSWWLDAHSVPYTELRMRGDSDDRRDTVFKRQHLEEITERYHIRYWIEDRRRVVDMVRASLPDTPTVCLQVVDGNY
jgi:putative phage polynucleotide kinase